MKKFKIFYSWQSDLPGNKTRNFLRECIDEAIELAQESETVEAEREEATTGTTGSPNIVTTLFSKIDNCDLFIADISLCFTGGQKTEKKSPNPNVLLELGYAVRTLGWERVICLCNTDYGDQYPFDIAHNRITDFSLEGRNRKEIKGDIAKIIFINIRDLKKQIPRAKSGTATHIIGTYDFESQKVIGTLLPIKISEQESYILHNEVLLDEAKKLIPDIQRLTDKIKVVKEDKEKFQLDSSKTSASSAKIQSSLPEAVHAIAESYKISETSVLWKDKEKDREQIKQWLGIEVPNDFFDLGELKQVVQAFNMCGTTLNGTDAEKEKYRKLHDLSYKLQLLDIRTNYLKTFEKIYYIPLAIQNISSMQDTDISVLVNVEKGEIVEPDEHLIWKDYEGLQGYLCRDDDEMDVGIICELFSLAEDGVIHIEDIPDDPSTFCPRMPMLTSSGFQQPDKTMEDYRKELEEFIASTKGNGYYEFNVTKLRPNECKWLYGGMLLRPVDGKVKIHYKIRSKYSMGNLSGVLEMKISKSKIFEEQ